MNMGQYISHKVIIDMHIHLCGITVIVANNTFIDSFRNGANDRNIGAGCFSFDLVKIKYVFEK